MSTEAIRELIEWADNFPHQPSAHYDLIVRANEELATLDAARQPVSPDLRAAAAAVIQHAEPDEGFEGEFAEYLVPADCIDALRAALDGATGPPRPVLDDDFYERAAAQARDLARYLANTEEPKP